MFDTSMRKTEYLSYSPVQKHARNQWEAEDIRNSINKLSAMGGSLWEMGILFKIYFNFYLCVCVSACVGVYRVWRCTPCVWVYARCVGAYHMWGCIPCVCCDSFHLYLSHDIFLTIEKYHMIVRLKAIVCQICVEFPNK